MTLGYVEDLPVTVIRSKNRRRTIAIQVRHDHVLVRAPQRTTDDEIRAVLDERRDWIQVAQIRAMEQQHLDHPVVSGTVWYEGNPYHLRCISRPGASWTVEKMDHEILVSGPDATPGHPRVRDALHGWYRRQAESILPTRLLALSNRYGYEANRVRVKEQKTRWGSCSAAKNINLNWRLIMAPPHVADYVMVHELCHLREMNHSARFWKLVRDIMPDFEEARLWLKTHAERLRW